MTSPERIYKKEERPVDCDVIEVKGDRYFEDGMEKALCLAQSLLESRHRRKEV